jgi:hypothetical protein
MNLAFHFLVCAALVAAPAGESGAAEQPLLKDFLDQGIKMSDGATVKLRAPIMADGLDAAGQLAAMGKVADARSPVDEMLAKSSRAPVITKIRTINSSEGEGPSVRTVDVWFVAHGDWNTLTSKDFLDSATASEGTKSKRSVVSKSGFLTDEELKKRNLSTKTADGREERFVYTTFSLFEQVQVSATRFSTAVKGKDSILAVGRIDARFDKDADYPNQWRPLLRDAQAEIKPGPAHLFAHAGGYAKITRLKKPADAVFVECHLVYEEPYGWFEGVNLVKQKVPVMVQEKVRSFRRKLALADQDKGETKDKSSSTAP